MRTTLRKYLFLPDRNRVFRLINRFTLYGIHLAITTKRIALPGFDGLPLYDVMLFFIKGLLKGNITTRASAISYNLFMAIFPTIIMFFTLIPFVPIDNFQEMLLGLMSEIFPEKAWLTVHSTVEDIITQPRSGLLSAGFVLALYFSTNGIQSFTDAFNSTIHHIETRSWFRQRLVNLFLVILMSLLVILSMALISLGNFTFGFLQEHHVLSSRLTYYILQATRWLILIALLYFGNSFLYYFAPARRNRFRFFSAGSSLATFLILATSLGFNYYINAFSTYNALYGSIGTLLIVMLWIWLNSMIVLIGFELNAGIYGARGKTENRRWKKTL
jgi:membrane protein